MKCLKPTPVWYCGKVTAKDGVLSPRLVFSASEADEYFSKRYPFGLAHVMMMKNEHSVPCGKCKACLLRKRKDMTVRLAHEAKMHDDACFVTLTYDDEHLPVTDDGSMAYLVPSDVQKFIKRLRRHLEYQPKFVKNRVGRDFVSKPIRYFCVGEYGSKTGRPHYHLIIYGWKPSDMVFHCQRKNYIISRSAQIEKLWTHGFSTVCSVNHGVAKYCARYVTKKFKTLEGDEHPIVPEFILQSTRDGAIGATWFDAFGKEACERGYVNVHCGTFICKAAVPQYYSKRLRKIYRPVWERIRDEHILWLRRNPVVDNYHDIERMVDCDDLCQKYLSKFETF